jgi:hypothetical protein
LRGGGSTRFQPNRRASIDHRPGPNIARAPPMVASKRGTHWSPGAVMIWQVSSKATDAPTMGVHSPGIRRSPHPARNTDVTIIMIGGSPHTAELARATSAAPRTRRMRSNPIPGVPPAKVEYRRRKTHLSKPFKLATLHRRSGTPKRGELVTLWSPVVRLRRGCARKTRAR